ncbi:MAG: hypothetical protein H0W33_03585 [Gammaproteobacteria bacterium]|nr:hypothetical protein [Gammaproteobacteria bacterium]
MQVPHKHSYNRESVDAFRVNDIYAPEGQRAGAFWYQAASFDGAIRGVIVRLPGAGLMLCNLDPSRGRCWTRSGSDEQPTLEPEIHAKPHQLRQFGWRGHLRCGRFESI